MQFEVYNRGRLVESFDNRKLARSFLEERCKAMTAAERRCWEIRPESPFKVVDAAGRVLAGFTTRREADIYRAERDRKSPGLCLRVTVTPKSS